MSATNADLSACVSKFIDMSRSGSGNSNSASLGFMVLWPRFSFTPGFSPVTAKHFVLITVLTVSGANETVETVRYFDAKFLAPS